MFLKLKLFIDSHYIEQWVKLMWEGWGAQILTINLPIKCWDKVLYSFAIFALKIESIPIFVPTLYT